MLAKLLRETCLFPDCQIEYQLVDFDIADKAVNVLLKQAPVLEALNQKVELAKRTCRCVSDYMDFAQIGSVLNVH